MRIAYTTTFDAQDVHQWSGTPHYMAKSFQHSGSELSYIGSLKQQLPSYFKAKQIWKKYTLGERESPRFNLTAAQNYSKQVAASLKNTNADVVISPLVNPVAFLECKPPIVLWTDALYAGLVGFYSPNRAPTSLSMAQGNIVTAACLANCSLAIFSSDWAANTAIELYGADKDKVKVVPFGANIDSYPSYDEVKALIGNRTQAKIKLLFLGKDWERKGGDAVLAVAQALHQAGHVVELTIAGCMPPNANTLPNYIQCLGFISKHTAEGKYKINQLLAETHFLFVPSKAEAYGIVFCEANAFGVPCLTTHVGGIGTVIKDNINGMKFSLHAHTLQYCDYIVGVMQNRRRYDELALSAYNEFTSRLNWKTSVSLVAGLIHSIR